MSSPAVMKPAMEVRTRLIASPPRPAGAATARPAPAASAWPDRGSGWPPAYRSEEHTSELQSLMRSSYAVFCLKKKSNKAKKQGQNITGLEHLPYKVISTQYTETKQTRLWL